MSDWHNIPNASDHLKWYQDAGRLKLNFFLSIIFMGMVLNGYDGSLISGLQAFDAWNIDLGYPEGTRLGILNAMGYIAGFCVGPVIAYVDDTYGRKWGIRFYGYTVLIGSVIGCVAGVSGTDGYAIFVTARAIIGLGLASFLMTSLVVVQEITHPRSRSTVAASWNSYYILGAIIVGWVNFGCSYLDSTSWSWRIPYILQVPMALYILIAVQFVPETPRFLVSQGREDEAFAFLVTYHGNGDENDALVHFEFAEMKEAIAREKFAKAERWMTILRNPGGRHRLGLAALMIFLTNMSGSSIIYFYYTIVFESVGITDPTAQTGIAAGLNVLTWFCQIGAVLLGKRVGKKRIIMTVWPLLLLSLAGLAACTAVFENSGGENSKAGVATVVLVWIFLGVFNWSNPVLFSYPAEVQTFSMRSKGLLVWNAASNLMYAFVVFVDPIALDVITWKYYFMYMALVILQFGLVWKYMVETKGYTLEEIAIAFDGSTANLVNVDTFPQVVEEGSSESTKERDLEVAK